MNITGMVANASVTVNATHTDGQVDFNITAFDLAGNNQTVNQTNAGNNQTVNQTTLSRPCNRSHKSNSLKSNNIQQQPPQHLTCNLG